MNSFLQGKKTLSIAPLKPMAAPAIRAAAALPGSSHSPAMASAHGQPKVEVVKEGDKVVRLIVICGCGERVEIECLYPAGS